MVKLNGLFQKDCGKTARTARILYPNLMRRLLIQHFFYVANHRRRIKTGDKVKVVAAVWGTALIQFLAMLAILHQDDLKIGMNSSFYLFCPGAVHPIPLTVLRQDFKSVMRCYLLGGEELTPRQERVNFWELTPLDSSCVFYVCSILESCTHVGVGGGRLIPIGCDSVTS